MTFVDRRTGLEVLDRAECLALLALEPVGRLGLVLGGHPLVLPVNYVLDGEHVVFRTAAGTKLDAATRSPVVFEVDRFDADLRTGWSVLVHGRAEEVTRYDAPERASALRRLSIEPWAEGEKDHWLRIVPEAITGRRLPTR